MFKSLKIYLNMLYMCLYILIKHKLSYYYLLLYRSFNCYFVLYYNYTRVLISYINFEIILVISKFNTLNPRIFTFINCYFYFYMTLFKLVSFIVILAYFVFFFHFKFIYVYVFFIFIFIFISFAVTATDSAYGLLSKNKKLCFFFCLISKIIEKILWFRNSLFLIRFYIFDVCLSIY